MLTEEVKQTIQNAYREILQNKQLRPRVGQRMMIAEIANAMSQGQDIDDAENCLWVDSESPDALRIGDDEIRSLSSDEEGHEFDKELLEDLADAVVTGLSDYCRKSGISSIVLGLSGGIDSAVAACVAAAAVGPENVTGIAMPSRHSSQHSIDDARYTAHLAWCSA